MRKSDAAPVLEHRGARKSSAICDCSASDTAPATAAQYASAILMARFKLTPEHAATIVQLAGLAVLSEGRA